MTLIGFSQTFAPVQPADGCGARTPELGAESGHSPTETERCGKSADITWGRAQFSSQLVDENGVRIPDGVHWSRHRMKLEVGGAVPNKGASVFVMPDMCAIDDIETDDDKNITDDAIGCSVSADNVDPQPP